MTSDSIISVIGMPGSGKSTVGATLARALGLELVDADGLIEAQEQQTLQQIMDTRGNAVFRAIEEQVLTQMPLFSSVISTGGSVIYSEKIMARLSAHSTVVYLRARFETIEYRVSLAPHRGIASDGEQTLRDLYEERVPLYERYGDIVVDCDDVTPKQITATIIQKLAT
ncbi:MAG: shikimate kinase [Gammaproteobacteria bacterium]|nr:shikimate kinase [Gammaproteobacteria bacterium]